jgi:antitoxin component YwqK of YwqJK toxin-antitoxin module
VGSYRLIPWKHGVRDGVEQEFVGRKLRAEVPWKDGKMHGTRKSFFADGTTQSESVYVAGQGNGPMRSWDEDGSLLSEGTLKDGQRHGPFTEYWPGSTQPKRVITYRNGVSHGLVRDYYRSGKIKRERHVIEETLHGTDMSYNETGEIIHARYWLDGDLVTRDEFEQRQEK